MSLYDYQQSQKLTDEGFYTLIMAAMRQADDSNLARIKSLWPREYEELKARYNAPGGILPSER